MANFREAMADIFEVDAADITSDTPLEDLNWDSLAMVSTIALFDEMYDREISIDALKACDTIGDLERLAQQ